MSSVPGLNAAPSTAIRLPGHIPASLIDRQLGELGPLAGVDRLDRVNEVAQHVTPSSSARTASAAMSLGRQPPPKPSPALRNSRPIRLS